MATTATDSDIGTVHVTAAHLARFEFKARGLALLPRQPRSSVLAGRHASRMRGRGLDFDEIRAYLPGDDIRSIDWKITQRTGKPQVRAYTEERDRPALLVVDQRMSMFFGSRRAMKSVVAAELAALAAWMAFHAGDRVGAVVFNDGDMRLVRPHRSRARVQEILGVIARMNGALTAGNPAPVDYAQLNRAIEAALRLAPHDHLIVVASDFAGADARTQDLLRQLAAHNDVIAALVFDPLARSPAPQGVRMVVTGGELQVELDTTTGAVRQPLEALFAGRLRDVGELLRRSGVPLMALDTAGDVVDQVRHLLGRSTTRRVGAGRSAVDRSHDDDRSAGLRPRVGSGPHPRTGPPEGSR